MSNSHKIVFNLNLILLSILTCLINLGTEKSSEPQQYHQ